MSGTGVFIQMRLNSSRLPQKVLLPLYGMSIACHVMKAYRHLDAKVFAIVTDKKSAPYLEHDAHKMGYKVFVGPEEDVLRRFVLAAKKFQVDTVVRGVGDAPLTCPHLIREALHYHLEPDIYLESDFTCRTGNPLGTCGEVFSTQSLIDADKCATEDHQREHVSPFIFGHFDTYNINMIPVRGESFLPDVKVSVDTREDYERIIRIYSDLYEGRPITSKELVNWIIINRM